MNQELKQVAFWLTANRLSLNVDKTKFMIFKTKKEKLNHKANVFINEQPINQVNYTKFLGRYIDEELSWKYHILKPCCAYPTRLKPILRTQKKLVRIITFANYTEKARPLIMSLKILNIYELNKYLTAMFMYSYHHDKLPAFLDNLFSN